jgi:hypothetical protein
MKPALYVFCSGERRRDAWRSRSLFHCDLEVTPIYPVRSGMAQIRKLAAQHDDPFLVCRDHVWIGLGMARQVERLVDELNARYPNWGACGNRGVRWDDRLLDYSRDVDNLGLRASLCAQPVISLDDNLLLINPRVLGHHANESPAIRTIQSGVLLSLECLANGSVIAVSPRLMTLRTETDRSDAQQRLVEDAEFQQYYGTHFVNHYFPAPAGGLLLTDVVDYGYISEPIAQVAQADLLDLHDRALESASRKPSLTICCRTQFRRAEMLERAALSFSVCRDHASLLSDLQIRLVTDQPEATAAPVLRSLERIYPAARLECWFHTVREKRLSRIDLLLAALERAETDYIWFVDDDDYVNPSAFRGLTRYLVPDCPLLVVASSPRVNEKWEIAPDRATGASKRVLTEARVTEGFSARNIFAVLRGDNQIPICGMIFPVKLLRERFRAQAALGEYCEDYFLLLLALTAPRVEVAVVEIDLATVSARGRENTVAETDRSVWHQSYATFLLEVLNNEEGNSPFLWQQANASPRDWMGS